MGYLSLSFNEGRFKGKEGTSSSLCPLPLHYPSPSLHFMFVLDRKKGSDQIGSKAQRRDNFDNREM